MTSSVKRRDNVIGNAGTRIQGGMRQAEQRMVLDGLADKIQNGLERLNYRIISKDTVYNDTGLPFYNFLFILIRMYDTEYELNHPLSNMQYHRQSFHKVCLAVEAYQQLSLPFRYRAPSSRRTP